MFADHACKSMHLVHVNLIFHKNLKKTPRSPEITDQLVFPKCALKKCTSNLKSVDLAQKCVFQLYCFMLKVSYTFCSIP